MKKSTVRPAANPTLPYERIEIDSKVYKVSFPYGALAAGETALRERGHKVSLLWSGPQVATFEHCRILFACALAAHHPELGFQEAQDLCTFDNCVEIYTRMQVAWGKSVPKVEADPEEAEETPESPSVSE